MARKRLAEFLREEAQKSLDVGDPAGVSNGEAIAPPPAQTPRSTSTKSPAVTHDIPPTNGSSTPQSHLTEKGEERMAPAKASEARPVAHRNGKASSTKPAAPTPSAAIAPENDEMADLKAALRDSRSREASLQHQIEMLQTELAEQKEQVQKLQAEQSHASQLQKDLEEARRVILQLTELNAKLHAAEPVQPVTVAPPPVPLAPPQPAAPPTSVRTSTPQPVPPHQSVASQMELRKVLQHPVTPTILPTTLSNEEIGWVD